LHTFSNNRRSPRQCDITLDSPAKSVGDFHPFHEKWYSCRLNNLTSEVIHRHACGSLSGARARAPLDNLAVVIASDTFSSRILEGFNAVTKITLRKTRNSCASKMS
jgi:hypothetical protein